MFAIYSLFLSRPTLRIRNKASELKRFSERADWFVCWFFFCKYSIELSSVVICNKSSSGPQLKFVNNVLGKNLEAISLELYDFWLSF